MARGILFLLAWFILLALSLAWTLHNDQSQIDAVAKTTAMANFNKDLSLRQWATGHGGVYVPITADTPASPYLSHVPERDIVTPSGKTLTLMNPAYMLRQVMEQYTELYGIRGHITSLKPLNPNNAPDDWEKNSLQSFENGAEEAIGYTDMHGKPYLRFMRPMITAKGCLKCHEHQGYKEGDIRGGIGVSVPMEPILAQSNKNTLILVHAIIWLLGTVMAAIVHKKLQKQEKIQQQTNEVLRLSEERFRTLFNVLPIPLCYVVKGREINDCNNKFATLFGYEKNEIATLEKWWQLAHPDPSYRDEVTNNWQTNLEQATNNGGTLHPRESNIVCKKGNILTTEIVGVTLGQDILLAFIDNTSRKQAEEGLITAKLDAEQANKAKSDFLAAMSHEIRTPLNAIIGMSEALWERDLGDTERHYVQVCRSAGDVLMSIVNDVLDMARIEADQMKLEQTPFNLRQKLNSSCEILASRAHSKGLKLNICLKGHLPDFIVGDPVRFGQILLNLLANAIKFTEKGEVSLTVQRIPANQLTPPVLTIAVTDTGIGIHPDKLPIIFDCFVQGDGTITRRYGGSGLGLSICKKLVEMMGGTIRADSIQGEGSRFTVTLPYIEPLEIPSLTSEAFPSLIPTPNMDSKTVLVVDDAEDNLYVIEAFLSATCCHMEFANNGEQAIEKFKRIKPDLVLMDVQMPILDGLSATRKIRAWETEYALFPTPIIALTANTQQEDVQLAMEAGCTSYLRKPFKKKELLDTVQHFSFIGG